MIGVKIEDGNKRFCELCGDKFEGLIKNRHLYNNYSVEHIIKTHYKVIYFNKKKVSLCINCFKSLKNLMKEY